MSVIVAERRASQLAEGSLGEAHIGARPVGFLLPTRDEVSDVPLVLDCSVRHVPPLTGIQQLQAQLVQPILCVTRRLVFVCHSCLQEVAQFQRKVTRQGVPRAHSGCHSSRATLDR
jgi:hypothetical protein